VAAGGPEAARLAAEAGDAIFATEPKVALVDVYTRFGGTGPAYCEVPLAWAPDLDTAVHAAWEKFRFGPIGWKVLAELPNPINFEAASAFVRDADIPEVFGCGPDPAQHLAVAQRFVDAGFDRLALINAGPDMEGFFDFAGKHLIEQVRTLEPGT
jgi:G6PDH family F420-dependent oxidoreductase